MSLFNPRTGRYFETDRQRELDAAMKQVRQLYADTVDKLCYEAVEKIEGRIPTNQEVHEHASRFSDDDGEIFFWKDKPIVAFKTKWAKDDEGKPKFEIEARRIPVTPNDPPPETPT